MQLFKDFLEVSVALKSVQLPGQEFTARITMNERFTKRPAESVSINAVLKLELDTDLAEDVLGIVRNGVKDGYVSPRYGIDAQTPPSVVYDYYNDEAKAVVAPLRFSVR